jgi:hypothetical protein
MSGLGQRQATCWLYTILNTFLLSENMRKILYVHMLKEYAAMDKDQREYFNNAVAAPCPLGHKFKKIYFYKFFDQYICALGGPGHLRKQAGMSTSLARRISAGSLKRRVTEGARTTEELIRVIKTLDITDYSHGTLYSYPGRFQETANRAFSKDNQFFIGYAGSSPSSHVYPAYYKNKELNTYWTHPYPRAVTLSMGKGIAKKIFELSAAGIVIQNDEYKGMHASHSICAYVNDGEGYIADSNYPKTPYKCRWWNPRELVKVVQSKIAPTYNFFNKNQITAISYSFFVYTQKAFVSKVVLACRLRARPLTFNTSRYMKYTDFNKLSQALSVNLKAGMITDAQKQKIIKNYLAKPQASVSPEVSHSTLRNVVSTAKTRGEALVLLKNLENAGYKIGENSKKFIYEKFRVVSKQTPSPRVSVKKTPSPPKKTRVRTPSRSNLNAAMSAVAKMKTIKARKEYKRQRAVNMTEANWKILSKYINNLNTQKRIRLENARQLKKQAKS